MKENPIVSIVIPVYNGIDTIDRCMKGIFRQTIISNMEVIAIDSGSTDGTLDVLANYDVRVVPIDKKDFNHGDTRNYGVSLAKGEFILMTVQDATPASDDWAERMLKHFDDPELAGVCGQQIVFHEKEKNPLQWFRPASDPVPTAYKFDNPEKFDNLSGKEQHEYCCWDDVNAMYRKSMKEKLPFLRISFAEDALWAKEALSKGYKIMYDYGARVEHYHHQTFKFNFKRSYTINYQNYKFFNFIRFPQNPFKSIPLATYRVLKMDLTMSEKLKWIKYNWRLIFSGWVSAIVFAYNAKLKGIKGVEVSHQRYCGLPPQGVQAKKKN